MLLTLWSLPIWRVDHGLDRQKFPTPEQPFLRKGDLCSSPLKRGKHSTYHSCVATRLNQPGRLGCTETVQCRHARKAGITVLASLEETYHRLGIVCRRAWISALQSTDDIGGSNLVDYNRPPTSLSTVITIIVKSSKDLEPISPGAFQRTSFTSNR